MILIQDEDFSLVQADREVTAVDIEAIEAGIRYVCRTNEAGEFEEALLNGGEVAWELVPREAATAAKGK